MAETPVPASKNLMLAFLGQRLLALQIQQTKQQAASPRSVAELSGLQNAIEEAQYANFVTLNGGPLQRTLGVMRIGVAPLDMTPNRTTWADDGTGTLAPPLAAATFPAPVTPPVPLATVPPGFPPQSPGGQALAPEAAPGFIYSETGPKIYAESATPPPQQVNQPLTSEVGFDIADESGELIYSE